MSDNDTPLHLLGTYQLCYRMVDVFLDPDSSDGSCNLCISEQRSRITVGCAAGPAHAWEVLVHEAFELAMADQDCAYHSTGMLDNYTQYMLFVMSHEQFTKVATGAAWLLHDAFIPLKKAFNQKGKLK